MAPSIYGTWGRRKSCDRSQPKRKSYDRSQVSHDVNLFDIQSKYGDVISLDEAVAYVEALQR